MGWKSLGRDMVTTMHRDDEEDDSGECDRWDDENNDLTKMKTDQIRAVD